MANPQVQIKTANMTKSKLKKNIDKSTVKGKPKTSGMKPTARENTAGYMAIGVSKLKAMAAKVKKKK